MIAKKPGFVTSKAVHQLFLRERGYGMSKAPLGPYSMLKYCTERLVGPYERPIRLQLLRLQQAGYTEWDRPEELGREDHSYLLKFIFKAETAPLKSTVSGST